MHELVRDKILDFDGKMLQQDILSISGLMRQVTNLRKESLRLAASIARLTSLRSVAAETADAHEQHVLNDLLLAQLGAASAQAKSVRHPLFVPFYLWK